MYTCRTWDKNSGWDKSWEVASKRKAIQEVREDLKMDFHGRQGVVEDKEGFEIWRGENCNGKVFAIETSPYHYQ